MGSWRVVSSQQVAALLSVPSKPAFSPAGFKLCRQVAGYIGPARTRRLAELEAGCAVNGHVGEELQRWGFHYR